MDGEVPGAIVSGATLSWNSRSVGSGPRMPGDPQSLAAGYLRYARSLRRHDDPDGVWSPETDPDCAAYKAVDRTIRNGPPAQAWELVVEVLRQAPDEDLGTEASGRLEDFVRAHGASMIEQIERFQWALGFVWLMADDHPTDILERIVQASGGAIKPLDRSKRHDR